MAAIECLEDRTLLAVAYVMGDWNGNRIDTLGTVTDGLWQLDTNGDNTYGAGDEPAFRFGLASDTPIAGDWDGDGNDSVGFVRTLNNGGLRWVFDLNDDRRFTAGVDRAFTFGTAATDLPVVGNWNGNRAGQDQAGLYRAQSGVDLWVLDANNDGAWSGPTIDRRINFGVLGGTTAQPVVGDWQADGIDDVGVYFNGNWEVDFDGDGVYSASDWSPRNPVGVGPFTYNAGGQITGGPGNARAITGNLSETPVSSSSDPLGQPRGDELVLVDPATGIYYFTTFAEPGYLAYTDARYTTASSITFTAQWNLQTFFAGADNRYDFRSARLLVRTNQMTTAQVIANVTQTNRPFVGSGIDRILYDGLRGTDSRNIAGSTFADLFVQFVAFDNQLGRIVVFSQPRTRVFNSF